jgi:regulator of cell morphogenesis and NO signaling
MQEDHEIMFNDLRLLRILTNNYMIPVDACNSYKELLEIMKQFENKLTLLIHLKNKILFTKVLGLNEKQEHQKKEL